LDLSLLVKASLNRSLNAWLKRDPSYTRYSFASELSRLTGREISKNMIDHYVAESKEEYRLPAELLSAWCFITKSIDPINAILAPLDYHLLSSEEWGRIEELRLMEQRDELDRKIQELKTKRRA